jgi:CheY-like chemotaxis protein
MTKKIMVIDDNTKNLIYVAALLQKYIPECNVETAASGAEDIARVKEGHPDTILLDINMPGMDGFEVCQRLKSDEEIRHIPVILLTGMLKDSNSRIKGLNTGADAFLTKPIGEAELVSQVNAMLRIKKSEDLLRKQKDVLETMVQERTRKLILFYHPFSSSENTGRSVRNRYRCGKRKGGTVAPISYIVKPIEKKKLLDEVRAL